MFRDASRSNHRTRPIEGPTNLPAFLHAPIHATVAPTRPLAGPALFDHVKPFFEPVPPRRGFCCIWAWGTFAKPLERWCLGLNFVRFHIVNFNYHAFIQLFKAHFGLRAVPFAPLNINSSACLLQPRALSSAHIAGCPRHSHR